MLNFKKKHSNQTKMDKEVILSELRSLEYLWIGRPIRNWFGGGIVGWNVYSSSILRKTYALERLQAEIEEKQLPLEIKDEPEMSNAFQVHLKNVA